MCLGRGVEPDHTAPTDPGGYGQIVEMVTNESDREVLWPGFRECLIAGLLARIEQECVDPEVLEDGFICFLADP